MHQRQFSTVLPATKSTVTYDRLHTVYDPNRGRQKTQGPTRLTSQGPRQAVSNPTFTHRPSKGQPSNKLPNTIPRRQQARQKDSNTNTRDNSRNSQGFPHNRHPSKLKETRRDNMPRHQSKPHPHIKHRRHRPIRIFTGFTSQIRHRPMPQKRQVSQGPPTQRHT